MSYSLEPMYDVNVPEGEDFFHRFAAVECPTKRAYVESLYFSNVLAAGGLGPRIIAGFFAPQEIQSFASIAAFVSERRKMIMFATLNFGAYTYNADDGKGWRVPTAGARMESRWAFWVLAVAAPGNGQFGIQFGFHGLDGR